MASLLSVFDSHTLVLLVAVAGVAGLARGFSGFGAALIFMPATSALVTPTIAAALLLIADGHLTLGFLPSAWNRANRKDVAVMATGALAGVPLGTAILNHADPLALRWAIAALVASMFVLLLSGWRYKAQPGPPMTIAVGAIAGLFGGMVQLAGPPVVAYWLSGHAHAAIVRANLILLFATTTMFTAVSYLLSGLLSLQAVMIAALVGPLYALGLYCGSRLFGLASEQVFRRLCFALIAISVISSLPVWEGAGP
jgi:uncharacterized protein